jgi:FixJ family two-component response regulator
VLVVEDDVHVRTFLSRALTGAGYFVVTAGAAADGVRLCLSRKPNLVLLDLRLPDSSGIDAMKQLQARGVRVPVVIVSGFLDVDVTVEAMKLGAADVIRKPTSMARLLSAVSSALASAAARPAAAKPHTIAERWALLVLQACECDGDLKTIDAWAHAAGHSASSIRETCRLAGVVPHDARDLMRILSAIIGARQHECRFDALLDAADARTLDGLLARARLTAQAGPPPSVEDFLARQRFIAADNEALRALQRLLARRSGIET